MNQELIDRFTTQTVKIRDAQGNALGTGFFINGSYVVTAEHCVHNDKIGKCNKVYLYRGFKELCRARVVDVECKMALLHIVNQEFSNEKWFPLGFCEDLQYGDEVEICGYPQRLDDLYPYTVGISINNRSVDNCGEKPSIMCLVKNTKGALDQYDGLSGSPVVAWNYIIGMVATEDEGKIDANAIHILDFSLVQEAFKDWEIDLKKVYRPLEGNAAVQNKANAISLYKQVWYIMKASMEENKEIKISDRYSIVLATLLLAMQGEANIIIASPWEYGLADGLQSETVRYEKEYPEWKGRRWSEYGIGRRPDWENIQEGSGVVLSIRAENCNKVWISESLVGRRICKNALVLWNVWSDQPQRAVVQAMSLADQFDAKEGKEVLSVFASWQEASQTKEEVCTALLVNETANDWMARQNWNHLDLDSFLLKLNSEETDILLWEVFQRYRKMGGEEWAILYKALIDVCSEPVKAFLSFYEKGDNWESLLEVEPTILKRWIAGMKKEECREILSYLRRLNIQVPYWIAITSNPYCTGDVIQEWCREEKRTLVKLIFSQNIETTNDILLYEEADNIRRQLKPR